MRSSQASVRPRPGAVKTGTAGPSPEAFPHQSVQEGPEDLHF